MEVNKSRGKRVTVSPVCFLLLVRKTFPKASGDLPGHIFFHKLVIGKEEIDLLHLVETSPGYSCVM